MSEIDQNGVSFTYCSCIGFRACGASQLPEDLISVMSDMCIVCAHISRWHTNSAHEQLGTALNNDINQDWQFSLGIIIADNPCKCLYIWSIS